MLKIKSAVLIFACIQTSITVIVVNATLQLWSMKTWQPNTERRKTFAT